MPSSSCDDQFHGFLSRKNENKSVKVDEFLGAEESLKVIADAMVSATHRAKPDLIYLAFQGSPRSKAEKPKSQSDLLTVCNC